MTKVGGALVCLAISVAVSDSVSELTSFEVGDRLFPLTATLASG